MKIAVIGAGVSGLVAAHRLTTQGHDVSVFEAGDRWGGHAQSVSLESEGVRGPIEVGFLVFNQDACPRLSGLLTELHTPTREIGVGYEIHHAESKMVLRGGSLRELLSVPVNLTVPSFYRVVPDWIRFTRKARRLLQPQCQPTSMTLGEFVNDGGYSDAFVEQFVYPLAGAVYPLNRDALEETPLACLLGFVHNHGLLSLRRDPSCRTLIGGSQGYLERLTDQIRDRIHLNCPIAAIARHEDYVQLKFPNHPRERFEQVVLAVHADIALRLLADPTRHERQALESFRYVPQNVYIHREDGPQEPSNASAVWKFQPSRSAQGGVALSYRISQVQGSHAPENLLLTMLGADQPPPREVMRTIRFRRPVFSTESLYAQRQFASVNGRRRTYFCGSYWGHGFHEDAVRSAEEVALRLAQDAARKLSQSGSVVSVT
jgi:predicted NAD/FAD-binding protein